MASTPCFPPAALRISRGLRIGQVEHITLHVLLGRAEGLERDIEALAESFVGMRGAIEDDHRISPGSAADFETWPVPFL